MWRVTRVRQPHIRALLKISQAHFNARKHQETRATYTRFRAMDVGTPEPYLSRHWYQFSVAWLSEMEILILMLLLGP